MKQANPSSLPMSIILAVFTSIFVVLTATGSFAQTDAEKIEKDKREYFNIYCLYQTALEDLWIAQLQKRISDEALDAIKKKAIKEKNDKAQSLPETLSALRRRGRAIYREKRAERHIELMEKFLFKQSLKESYRGDPPSKADC